MARGVQSVKDGWNKFLLNLIGEKASPAFYQHVSHIVFRALIELEYPLSNTTSSAKTSYQPLTFEEQNALRYVRSWVCLQESARTPRIVLHAEEGGYDFMFDRTWGR